MSNELNPVTDFDEPLAYQIRFKGQLGGEWAAWFGGLSITLEDNGTTLLTSPAIDQAALHGLLKKVRDLGLPLLSINPIEPDRPEVTSGDPDQSHTKGNEK
jgi:hypothetical protein